MSDIITTEDLEKIGVDVSPPQDLTDDDKASMINNQIFTQLNDNNEIDDVINFATEVYNTQANNHTSLLQTIKNSWKMGYINLQLDDLYYKKMIGTIDEETFIKEEQKLRKQLPEFLDDNGLIKHITSLVVSQLPQIMEGFKYGGSTGLILGGAGLATGIGAIVGATGGFAVGTAYRMNQIITGNSYRQLIEIEKQKGIQIDENVKQAIAVGSGLLQSIIETLQIGNLARAVMPKFMTNGLKELVAKKTYQTITSKVFANKIVNKLASTGAVALENAVEEALQETIQIGAEEIANKLATIPAVGALYSSSEIQKRILDNFAAGFTVGGVFSGVGKITNSIYDIATKKIANTEAIDNVIKQADQKRMEFERYKETLMKQYETKLKAREVDLHDIFQTTYNKKSPVNNIDVLDITTERSNLVQKFATQNNDVLYIGDLTGNVYALNLDKVDETTMKQIQNNLVDPFTIEYDKMTNTLKIDGGENKNINVLRDILYEMRNKGIIDNTTSVVGIKGVSSVGRFVGQINLEYDKTVGTILKQNETIGDLVQKLQNNNEKQKAIKLIKSVYKLFDVPTELSPDTYEQIRQLYKKSGLYKSTKIQNPIKQVNNELKKINSRITNLGQKLIDYEKGNITLTKKQLTKIQSDLSKLEKKAKVIELKKDIINSMPSSMTFKTLEEMTGQDIFNLLQKKQELVEIGRLKKQYENRKFKQEIQKITNGIFEEASKQKTPEEIAQTQDKLVDYLKRKFKHIDLETTTRARTIAKMFGEKGSKLFYDAVNEAENKYIQSTISKQTGEYIRITKILQKEGFSLKEAYKKIKYKEIEEIAKAQLKKEDYKIYQKYFKTVSDMTVSEMMNIYAGKKNYKYYSEMLKSNGLSDDLVKLIELILPDKYKKVADKVMELYSEFYKQHKPLLEKISGRYWAEVPNYIPLIRENTFGEIDEFNMLEQFGYPTEGRKNITQYFLEERKTGNQPLHLDLIGNLYNYLRAVNRYIAYQEPLKIMQNVLKDNELRLAIINQYDVAGIKFLQDYYNDLARPSHWRANDMVSRVMRTLRNNIGLSILGFNVLVAGKQLLSVLHGVNDLGVSQVLKGYMMFITRPKTMYDILERYAPQIKYRSIDTTIDDLYNMTKGQLLNAKEKVQRASMQMIRLMDSLVVQPLWYSYFDKYVGEGLSVEEASNKATQDLLKKQPSTHPKDIAPIYHKSEFLNLLMMFTNQINKNFNVLTKDMINDINTIFGKSADVNERYLAFKHTLAIVSNLVITAILLGAFNKTPPEDEKELMEMVLSTGLGYIPVVGGTISSAMRGFRPSTPVLKVGFDTGKLINATLDWDTDAMGYHTVSLISDLIGINLRLDKQLNNTIEVLGIDE